MVDACRRGGLGRRRPVVLPELEALSPQETRGILAGVLQALLVGALDDKTARSVGYLLTVDSRIFETVELERRVIALENLQQLCDSS